MITLWVSWSSLATAVSEPPPDACGCTRAETRATSPSAAPAGGCCSPRALVVVGDQPLRRILALVVDADARSAARAPSATRHAKGHRPEPLDRRFERSARGHREMRRGEAALGRGGGRPARN